MIVNKKYTYYLKSAEILDKKLSSKKELAKSIFPINFLIIVVLSVPFYILNVNLLIRIIVVIIMSTIAGLFYYTINQEIHMYKISLFTTLSALSLEVLTENPVHNDIIMVISKVYMFSNKYYNDFNFFEEE